MTGKTGAGAGCSGAANQADCFRPEMPPAEEIKKQSEFFKAISDPARVRIIYALKDGELCVCQLMQVMDMPQTVVSHHLKVLKYAGIINDQRAGKWIYYSLVDSRAVSVLDGVSTK
jgi:DNA-binding transcriptional ArsR family regulator